MTRRIIYPGTFDPLTRGHEDLVRRAASIFDEVVVAVGANVNKAPYFSIEERVEMASHCLRELVNVQVKSFAGLLLDFVREQNTNLVLRGLRAVSDGLAGPGVRREWLEHQAPAPPDPDVERLSPAIDD